MTWLALIVLWGCADPGPLDGQLERLPRPWSGGEVYVGAPHDLYTLGAGSTWWDGEDWRPRHVVSHWDGEHWRARYGVPTEDFAVDGAGAVWAVSPGGVVRLDGDDAEVLPAPEASPIYLSAVGGEIWASSHISGSVHAWRDEAWQDLGTPGGAMFHIVGSPDDAWGGMVDFGHTMAHYDGTAWTTHPVTFAALEHTPGLAHIDGTWTLLVEPPIGVDGVLGPSSGFLDRPGTVATFEDGEWRLTPMPVPAAWSEGAHQGLRMILHEGAPALLAISARIQGSDFLDQVSVTALPWDGAVLGEPVTLATLFDGCEEDRCPSSLFGRAFTLDGDAFVVEVQSRGPRPEVGLFLSAD